jgi:hypothetical protein
MLSTRFAPVDRVAAQDEARDGLSPVEPRRTGAHRLAAHDGCGPSATLPLVPDGADVVSPDLSGREVAYDTIGGPVASRRPLLLAGLALALALAVIVLPNRSALGAEPPAVVPGATPAAAADGCPIGTSAASAYHAPAWSVSVVRLMSAPTSMRTMHVGRACRPAALDQEHVMQKRRMTAVLAASLLAFAGLAAPAYAADPGPDPNESGVTETADLDEGTEVADPDDAVDSSEEAAENTAGETTEDTEGVGTEVADTEGVDTEVAEVEDTEGAEAADPEVQDVEAQSGAEVEGEELAAGDDSSDECEDDDGDACAEESQLASMQAGGAVSDSAVSASTRFTG